MLRREFMGGLTAGAAAILNPLSGSGGFVAPAASRLDRIGIQLYTVRRELAKDAEGTLSRLAGIGYREVEFAGYPEGTGPSLRAMLDRLRLTAPSSHVGLHAIRTDWDRTLDLAAAVGQRYIVVASIPEEDRRTADDWKRLAAAFNRAGETARGRKIQFAYHNHDVEFAPLGPTIGYDILLAETEPRLVAFEMDLYWITKGGRDPLAYFARWPGRFPLVHVKDMDATPRRFFADLGQGTIDFRRIFRRAGQAGIRHYFYEQDETPGSPFESARVSFNYLRRLTF